MSAECPGRPLASRVLGHVCVGLAVKVKVKIGRERVVHAALCA